MAKTRQPLSDSVAKWQRNTGAAQQYYQSGVQRATGWSAAAIAAAPRRNAGLQAAIANGTIDAGIQRVGDGGWKSATLSKGVANWAAATQKSGDKFQAGLSKVYGFLDAASAATANIDTSTVEGRLEKARVHALTMHQQSQAAKRGM